MKNSAPSIVFASVMIFATVFTFVETSKADSSQVIDGTMENTQEVSATVTPGKRPPVYLTALLTGGVFHEDQDNRLTSHNYTGLLTPGLALRLGGVIKNHHLVGARFQGTWRSTQAVLDSTGGDNEWGAVSSYYLGPEYRYQMQNGFYFGITTGVTFVLADNDVGSGGSPECNSDWCVEEYLRNSDNTGFMGLGVIGSVGYEHRVNRRFALNIEAYMGVLEGEDENYEEMTIGTYGIAFGVGI